MSLTLTIGGTDFLPRYKTNSSQVTSQIQNQGDTFLFSLVIKSGGTLPQTGQEVVFKDGSRFLFGGYLSRLTPVEYGIGKLIEYQCEATDYTYLLVNKNVQETYTNQTLGFIVADLLTKYVASGYGLTHVNTAAGPTVATVTFNHIPLRQCFEKLAKLTNYVWYLDYQKDVHFFDPNNAPIAPEKVSDTSANIEQLAINSDVSQVRNNIVLQGGISESANFQDIFIGDAQARGWVLTNTVVTMVSIELDTGSGYVSKVVGKEGVDDESISYFMYVPDRGSFRMAVGSPTPAVGNKIRVTYTYPLAILTTVQDAGSVIFMMALEGGDGIHSYTITDSTLVSLAQAKARGIQELAAFSLPILEGQFVTRTGLLAAGSFFAPGQAITVNFPSWGISTDTIFIIQKVVTTISEGLSGLEYHYTVFFGGRMLGVSDFLLALATPEQALDTATTLQKVFSVSETVKITELITRNGNLRFISETATIVETITKRNFTPPFVWDDATNSKWNEAEWS